MRVAGQLHVLFGDLDPPEASLHINQLAARPERVEAVEEATPLFLRCPQEVLASHEVDIALGGLQGATRALVVDGVAA